MVLLPLKGNLIRDEFFEKRSGPKGGGRIVVVGNSAMARDRSGFVDSANCVMRFSRCIHYNSGRTGTKTDILALRACRAFTRDPTTPDDIHVYNPEKMKEWIEREVKSMQPWYDCEEMWITGAFLNYEMDIKPYAVNFPEMLKKEVRIVHISPLHQYVFGLPKHGFPDRVGNKLIPLTTGVVMILHLLTIRYLRAWKIQLVGFNDFKQQPGDPSHISIAHEVEFDKRVLRSLDEAGYIELCD